ncbi:hypothetical protein [Amycolatopsis sp. cmx-4-83]|uniref:hypothetical protein n=1 Tax=Amycolatopsis sp. cmx-4-83 TaxID=2790940 RepID=UPI00397D29A4
MANTVTKTPVYPELIASLTTLSDRLAEVAEEVQEYGESQVALAEAVRKDHEDNHADSLRWCSNETCRLADQVLTELASS